MYRSNCKRFSIIQQNAKKKKDDQEKKKQDKLIEKEKKKTEDEILKQKNKIEKEKTRNGKLLNDGSRWTDEDTNILIMMLREKKSYAEISHVLERSSNGLIFKKYQIEKKLIMENKTKRYVSDYLNITNEDELDKDLADYEELNNKLKEKTKIKNEEQKMKKKTENNAEIVLIDKDKMNNIDNTGIIDQIDNEKKIPKNKKRGPIKKSTIDKNTKGNDNFDNPRLKELSKMSKEIATMEQLGLDKEKVNLLKNKICDELKEIYSEIESKLNKTKNIEMKTNDKKEDQINIQNVQEKYNKVEQKEIQDKINGNITSDDILVDKNKQNTLSNYEKMKMKKNSKNDEKIYNINIGQII